MKLNMTTDTLQNTSICNDSTPDSKENSIINWSNKADSYEKLLIPTPLLSVTNG